MHQDLGILDALKGAAVRLESDGRGPDSICCGKALATGRAFWRSLQAGALREGGAREVPFAWQALPNGDQRLICETPGPLDFLLEHEPAVYIDTASGDCGPLLLALPPWICCAGIGIDRSSIRPRVSAVNANLACEPLASGFRGRAR